MLKLVLLIIISGTFWNLIREMRAPDKCHKCLSQDLLFLDFTVTAGESRERSKEKGKMEFVVAMPRDSGRWLETPQHSFCGWEQDVKARS